MQITLTKAESPRYTIWRALNPAGRNWDFMAWIRSEWAACRKEWGVASDHATKLVLLAHKAHARCDTHRYANWS